MVSSVSKEFTYSESDDEGVRFEDTAKVVLGQRNNEYLLSIHFERTDYIHPERSSEKEILEVTSPSLGFLKEIRSLLGKRAKSDAFPDADLELEDVDGVFLGEDGSVDIDSILAKIDGGRIYFTAFTHPERVGNVMIPAYGSTEEQYEQNNHVEQFYELVDDYIQERESTPPATLGAIEHVCRRFPLAVTRLQDRYNNRPSVEIQDEHDVQDILHALLAVQCEDLRKEEAAPSHGGSASRIDFLLKDEKIGVEVKLASENHDEREIKSELAEDKEHYRAHPDCSQLVCFVYDPRHAIENPDGFESDLSGSDSELLTSVVVAPTLD
ncbi:hypothetical protein [Halorarius halobius]|uniref:PD-(D/E)XK nuclease domain-containing protein n=1 Tax=Halorarius halobius TaxID=2962671 RepID=UPI0020CC7862|nr:hypothetical protein [Halorarius halobius]